MTTRKLHQYQCIGQSVTYDARRRPMAYSATRDGTSCRPIARLQPLRSCNHCRDDHAVTADAAHPLELMSPGSRGWLEAKFKSLGDGSPAVGFRGQSPGGAEDESNPPTPPEKARHKFCTEESRSLMHIDPFIPHIPYPRRDL